MTKEHIQKLHTELTDMINGLREGDITYFELGAYVYDVVGEDLLGILADLLEGD